MSKFKFNGKAQLITFEGGQQSFTLKEAKRLLSSLEKAIQRAEDAKLNACSECGHNLSHMVIKGADVVRILNGEGHTIKCPKCKTKHCIRAAWQKSKLVCDVCNDTHMMRLHDGNEETDQQVMCVHCPTPCQTCRSGAYCKITPCDCKCHASHWRYMELNK
jgi:hypothetical protein